MPNRMKYVTHSSISNECDYFDKVDGEIKSVKELISYCNYHVYLICIYNLEGKFHSYDEPAVRHIGRYSEFWIHGKEYSYQDWKIEQNRYKMLK